MPRIDEKTVDAVARLARLQLGSDERTRFARELEAILAWAESLQALDTAGVPPMAAPPRAEDCATTRRARGCPAARRWPGARPR